MKRKIYSLLVGAIFITTLFVGCGQNDDSNNPSFNNPNTPSQSEINSETDNTQDEVESRVTLNFKDHITVTYVMDSNGGGYTMLDIDRDAIDNLISAEDLQKLIEDYPKLSYIETFSDLFTFNNTGKDELINDAFLEVYCEIHSTAFYYGVSIETLEDALGVNIEEKIVFDNSEFVKTEAMDLTHLLNFAYIKGPNGRGTAEVYFYNAEGKYDDYLYMVADYSNRINFIYNHKDMGYIELNCNTNTLSKGDDVIFSVDTWGTDKLKNIGYYLPKRIKMVAPDLGEYISSPDQITEEFLNQVVSDVKAQGSSRLRIEKIMFGTIKPTAIVDDYEREKYILCVVPVHNGLDAKRAVIDIVFKQTSFSYSLDSFDVFSDNPSYDDYIWDQEFVYNEDTSSWVTIKYEYGPGDK